MKKGVILSLGLMLCSTQAHAYLDGGSASLLIQVVLGGIAGAAAVIKVYWQRIKGFFTGQKPSQEETDEFSAILDEVAEEHPLEKD